MSLHEIVEHPTKFVLLNGVK